MWSWNCNLNFNFSWKKCNKFGYRDVINKKMYGNL